MRKGRWLGHSCVVAVVAGGAWECSGSSNAPNQTWTNGNGTGSGGPSNLSAGDASTRSGSNSGGSGGSSGVIGSSTSSGSSSSSSGGSSSGSSGSSSGTHPSTDAGHKDSGSSSGTSSSSGSSSGTVQMGNGMPRLPMALEACPQLVTGAVTVLGQSVTIFAGTKGSTPAPILFYWHGTGSSASEVQSFMSSQITEITGQGGLVASFSTSLATGMTTGNNVWYVDDFKMCDQILACAVQQLNIDMHQIYTAGCSAGGLQAGAMLYLRSSYLAAAMPNSGGINFPGAYQLEDPSHVPALITAHGAMGSDVVVIDFSTASLNECMDVKSKGGFAVDCNHGGGHCMDPANAVAAQWQFCKDHPFGVSPEPYKGGLPSSFPSFCTIQ